MYDVSPVIPRRAAPKNLSLFRLLKQSAFAALNAVFADAADYWREDGVPFWVFYDLRADGLAALPTVA